MGELGEKVDGAGALEERWRACCARLGARAHDAKCGLAWHVIEALYAFPARSYHTLAHVAEVLRVFDEFAHESERPAEVECALFLHDAVYVPGRGDNEARSAAVASMLMREMGCNEAAIGRVSELILATMHSGDVLAGDAELVADIDLSILGASAAEYDRYARGIAAEYAFAGAEQYRAGRRAFLEGLLERPHLFGRGVLRERFEVAARVNIGRELEWL